MKILAAALSVLTAFAQCDSATPNGPLDGGAPDLWSPSEQQPTQDAWPQDAAPPRDSHAGDLRGTDGPRPDLASQDAPRSDLAKDAPHPDLTAKDGPNLDSPAKDAPSSDQTVQVDAAPDQAAADGPLQSDSSQPDAGAEVVGGGPCVAGRSWTPPLQLDQSSSAKEPDVAMDASGRVLVVWGDSSLVVWQAAYDPSSGWSTPSSLIDGARSPKVVLNSAGFGGAAVLRHVYANPTLFKTLQVRSYAPGTGWGLSAGGGCGDSAKSFDLAVDDQGNLYGVCVGKASLHDDVYYAIFRAAYPSPWAIGGPIAGYNSTSEPVSLLPAGLKATLALWRDKTLARAAPCNGSGWKQPSTVNWIQTSVDAPLVTASRGTQGLVAWREKTGWAYRTVEGLRVTLSGDYGSWSSAKIRQSATTEFCQVALTLDASGTGLAAVRSCNPSTLEVIRQGPGGSWGPPATLLADSKVYDDLKLTSDGTGQSYLLMGRYQNGSGPTGEDLWVSCRSTAGVWSLPEQLTSNGAVDWGSVRAAAAGDGRAATVWSAGGHVYVSLFK